MIKLVDANNVARRRLLSGEPNAVRNIFIEAAGAGPETIWVWDGKGANDRRRAIFPGYKTKRPAVTEDLRAMLGLIREVLGWTGVTQITVPGYEADDVIATMAPIVPCEIVSNDLDFGQLGDLPDVRLNCRMIEGVDAKRVRLYKATVGDPKDNIPGIPGFGPISYAGCSKNRFDELLQEWSIGADCEPFRELNIAKRFLTWFEDAANRKLIANYWKIVGFFDVPFPEINQHTKPGRNDLRRGDALLKEFML